MHFSTANAALKHIQTLPWRSHIAQFHADRRSPVSDAGANSYCICIRELLSRHVFSLMHIRSPYPSTRAINPGGSKRCPNVSDMCSLVRRQRPSSFHTLRQAVCSMLFQIDGSGSIPMKFISPLLKMLECSFRWVLMGASGFSRKLMGTGSSLSSEHPIHRKFRMLHLIMFEWRNIGLYSVGFVGSACSIPIPTVVPLTKSVLS